MAIAIMLPLVVLLGTVVLLGWQLQVIDTGSMEPTYTKGSLAVIEPIDAADVRAGMTLVFRDPLDPDRLVAHRAVHRYPGELPKWQTKGDANATPDPLPVEAREIRGRIRWAVPRLGRLTQSVRGFLSPYILVGAPLALLAITEIGARRRRRGTASLAAV